MKNVEEIEAEPIRGGGGHVDSVVRDLAQTSAVTRPPRNLGLLSPAPAPRGARTDDP
jgi:hypothetical protein